MMKAVRLSAVLLLFAATLLSLSVAPSQASHPVDPGNAHQVKLGKSVFSDNCVVCHGKNLKGPEDPKDFDGLKPPRLDADGHATHHGDHFYFDRVKNGTRMKSGEWNEKGMPPFKDALSDTEIWAAISYIKSTWPMTARMKQDKQNPGHGREQDADKMPKGMKHGPGMKGSHR